MDWFNFLSPETQAALIDLAGKAAPEFVGGLTVTLLEAAGKRTAQLFKSEPRQHALQSALAEGLAAAILQLPLTPETSNHYYSLFREFIQREDVILELSLIINPNPDTFPDIELLRDEFIAAGFDPDYLTQPKFEDLIAALILAFYDAAADKPELQHAISIRLLREMVENFGALARDTKRIAFSSEHTAAATEITAEGVGRIVMILEQMLRGQAQPQQVVEEIRSRISTAPGSQITAYQDVAFGLFQIGKYLEVDLAGRITIPEVEVKVDLAPLLELLQEMRRGLIQPSTAPTAEELVARKTRYLELITSLYKDLHFEGLSSSVRPIVLPLERVYVQLRAVAEVPEAADVFSPEERRLLRLFEEEGKEEDLREAQLRLDALRRERWTKERLERFPIAESLRKSDQHGLVILGDPGSGKTTLLHFLALVYAQGPQKVHEHLKISGADAERLPIFVPLAAYDDMLSGVPTTDRAGISSDLLRSAPGFPWVGSGF